MNGRPCVWPDCLDEDQTQALLDAVAAVDRGEQSTPMPDQRPVCRCAPEDVKHYE